MLPVVHFTTLANLVADLDLVGEQRTVYCELIEIERSRNSEIGLSSHVICSVLRFVVPGRRIGSLMIPHFAHERIAGQPMKKEELAANWDKAEDVHLEIIVTLSQRAEPVTIRQGIVGIGDEKPILATTWAYQKESRQNEMKGGGSIEEIY